MKLLDKLRSPDVIRSLYNEGYCILKNVLPSSYTTGLRKEIDYLRMQHQTIFHQNSTHILLPNQSSTPQLLQKHHIYEVELVDNTLQSCEVPILNNYYHHNPFVEAFQNRKQEWIHISHGMTKLQYNEGYGGCFPFHFDSYGEGEGFQGSSKILTAIMYLNNSWESGDGGELILYPFPRIKFQRIVIPPRAGDVVLFSSQQMLHRVSPSLAPRYCLTTWLYTNPKLLNSNQVLQNKRARNAYYKLADTQDNDLRKNIIRLVLSSKMRRHLARLVYAKDWQKSLIEAQIPTDVFKHYMNLQQKEVDLIRQRITQFLQFAHKQYLNERVHQNETDLSSISPMTVDELLEILHNPEFKEFFDNVPIPWF